MRNCFSAQQICIVKDNNRFCISRCVFHLNKNTNIKLSYVKPKHLDTEQMFHITSNFSGNVEAGRKSLITTRLIIIYHRTFWWSQLLDGTNWHVNLIMYIIKLKLRDKSDVFTQTFPEQDREYALWTRSNFLSFYTDKIVKWRKL